MRNPSPENEKRLKGDFKNPDRLRKRWFYIAGGASAGCLLSGTLVLPVMSAVTQRLMNDMCGLVFSIAGIVVGGWLGNRWFKKKSKS
jgi:hypothetical protein